MYESNSNITSMVLLCDMGSSQSTLMEVRLRGVALTFTGAELGAEGE